LKYAYLHGFASGPASGKARYLKERFAVRGVDLLVPELAPEGLETLTVSGQLAIIEALRPDVLIGSSMGGYLSALYASRHSNVERLVLLAPAFGFPLRWPDKLGPEKTEAWRSTGFMDVYHYAEDRPARVGWCLMEDARQFPPEPDFRQPALAFHGRNDDTVPMECSEAFAATHSNVTLRVLDSDHQLTDSVELIWRETQEFLGI
jgi:pimeloyl-ACP methyl ester carboxylesterase